MSNLRHSFHDKNSVSGFSLVELSIVLVILGLLTGGILAGQSLIKAAELRKISKQIEQYKILLYTFEDKYGSSPGDMSNAESFWGQSSACGGADNEGVCNGDDNGIISPQEGFQFWRHASKAGLLNATYTGVREPDGSWEGFTPGSNVPSVHEVGLWKVEYFIFAGQSAVFANMEKGNFLSAYADSFWANGYRELFIPEDMWNIDSKIDDGKPATGRVVSWRWGANCTNASNRDDLTADYRFDYTSPACHLSYRDFL